MPLPASDTLRALPPNAALRSYTVTAKPRSASSCAALSPPTPPPRIATACFTAMAPPFPFQEDQSEAGMPLNRQHQHAFEAAARFVAQCQRAAVFVRDVAGNRQSQ